MTPGVAILAGGRGTRLQPVSGGRQKVVAEVGTRPFLTYLLDQLADAGFPEAVLLVGHRAEQVMELLGDGYRGVRLRYSQESSPLGTGGAVRHALPHLPQETLLLLNGDSFARIDLAAFVRFHEGHAAPATLALASVDDVSRYGRVTLGPGGRIGSFEEKGQTRGAGWINAGVYLFARRLFETVPEGVPVSLERDLLPGWVARGEVMGWCGTGRFLDIGTPESYRTAPAFFAAG